MYSAKRVPLPTQRGKTPATPGSRVPVWPIFLVFNTLRNDGNVGTCGFIASPETCLAYAMFGTFNVNPYAAELQAT